MAAVKRVLITGGAGGIASAINDLLVSIGEYEVYSPTRRELDVTDSNQAEIVIRNYNPDVLVNCAGYVKPQSIRQASYDEIKRHIDVNLTGVFYCTAAALGANPECRVVNVGSAAATTVHATWSEYCATKAAVAMAAKCWAEDGVYSVTISPGRTRTKMRKALYPNEDQSTLMDPTDFARVVLKGIRGEFPSGTHLVVHKEDIPRLLGGEML